MSLIRGFILLHAAQHFCSGESMSTAKSELWYAANVLLDDITTINPPPALSEIFKTQALNVSPIVVSSSTRKSPVDKEKTTTSPANYETETVSNEVEVDGETNEVYQDDNVYQSEGTSLFQRDDGQFLGTALEQQTSSQSGLPSYVIFYQQTVQSGGANQPQGQGMGLPTGGSIPGLGNLPTGGANLGQGGQNMPGGQNLPGGQNMMGGQNMPGGQNMMGGQNTPGGPNMMGGQNMPGGQNMMGGQNMPGGQNMMGGQNMPGGQNMMGGQNMPGGQNMMGGQNLPGGQNMMGGQNMPGGQNMMGGQNLPGGQNMMGGQNMPGGQNMMGGQNNTVGQNMPVGQNMMGGQNMPSGNMGQGGQNMGVPQQLQNLPQQLQNLPQQLQNLPQQLQNLPQAFQNFPQQLQNLPQQLQNLPQLLQNLPQGFLNLGNQPQTLPQYLNNNQGPQAQPNQGNFNPYQNQQMPQGIQYQGPANMYPQQTQGFLPQGLQNLIPQQFQNIPSQLQNIPNIFGQLANAGLQNSSNALSNLFNNGLRNQTQLQSILQGLQNGGLSANTLSSLLNSGLQNQTQLQSLFQGLQNGGLGQLSSLLNNNNMNRTELQTLLQMLQNAQNRNQQTLNGMNMQNNVFPLLQPQTGTGNRNTVMLPMLSQATASPLVSNGPMPYVRIRTLTPGGSVTKVNVNSGSATQKRNRRNKNTLDDCIDVCGDRREPICASPVGARPLNPDNLKGFPTMCHLACHNSFRKNAYEKVIDGRCGKLRNRIRTVDNVKLKKNELDKVFYTVVQQPDTVIQFTPMEVQ